MSTDIVMALAPRSVPLNSPALSGVYFIQRGEDGPIKIGWSNNVRARLATLQTAHHERLHLRLVLDGQPRDERRLHAWFADERIGGEWFRTGGEVESFVVSTANAFDVREEAYQDGHVIGWTQGYDAGLDWAEENWSPKTNSTPLDASRDYFDRCESLLAKATGYRQEHVLHHAVEPEDMRVVTVYAGDLLQLLHDSRNSGEDPAQAYAEGFQHGRSEGENQTLKRIVDDPEFLHMHLLCAAQDRAAEKKDGAA